MAKSAEAFRTISEAAEEVGVPQHVLRHWEDVFGHIRPMRRAGGRRYYRPIDLDLLRGVRALLYDERYTTKGVQKIFRDNGVKYITELGRRVAEGEALNLRRDFDGTDHSKSIDEQSDGVARVPSDTEFTSPATAELVPAADEKAAQNAAAADEIAANTAAQLGTLIKRLETVQKGLNGTIAKIETLVEETEPKR